MGGLGVMAGAKAAGQDCGCQVRSRTKMALDICGVSDVENMELKF